MRSTPCRIRGVQRREAEWCGTHLAWYEVRDYQVLSSWLSRDVLCRGYPGQRIETLWCHSVYASGSFHFQIKNPGGYELNTQSRGPHVNCNTEDSVRSSSTDRE